MGSLRLCFNLRIRSFRYDYIITVQDFEFDYLLLLFLESIMSN